MPKHVPAAVALFLFAGILMAHAREFQTHVDYATGYLPYSVAIGDFNGDHKLDLVVANSDNHAKVHRTVSVLLGNGDGTFQPQVQYGTGNGAVSVAVGDFNGDGKLDIVTANLHDSAVNVLLGNGDGSFQPSVEYGTLQRPWSVAIGDFNGDGKLDLAVACGNSDGRVSVLLGNGDGSFQASVNYAIGTSPHSIAVGDFNGDGRPDLVVANPRSDTVSVLIGKGDGTFSAHVDYGTDGTPYSVAVADFNHDGKLDLATANYGYFGGGKSVSVLLGNGDGTFQAHADYPTNGDSQGVAVGDFNNDGNPDLVAANYALGGDTVSVLLGNGDGTFQAHADYRTGSNRLQWRWQISTVIVRRIWRWPITEAHR